MPVVFPYVKNPAWADGSGGATPISAAKLNIYEDGIFNAHQQPAVRAFHSAAQSVANATIVALAFNSERFDQAGGAASTMHDLAVNNSRLTCRYAGIYEICATIEWASAIGSASGTELRFRVNGATAIARVLAVSSDSRVMSLATHYSLAVNDYVEAVVQQNTGAPVNVNSSANYSPEFSMVRVA